MTELKKPAAQKSHNIHREMIFPQILMRILSDPANADSITWLPNGKAFVIINAEKFTKNVLPKYFGKTKYASFTRKLCRWNFSRVKQKRKMPPAYYHEHFRRGEEMLCTQMYCLNKRTKHAENNSYRSGKEAKTRSEILKTKKEALIAQAALEYDSHLSANHLVAELPDAKSPEDQVGLVRGFGSNHKASYLNQKASIQNGQLPPESSEVNNRNDGNFIPPGVKQLLKKSVLGYGSLPNTTMTRSEREQEVYRAATDEQQFIMQNDNDLLQALATRDMQHTMTERMLRRPFNIHDYGSHGDLISSRMTTQYLTRLNKEYDEVQAQNTLSRRSFLHNNPTYGYSSSPMLGRIEETGRNNVSLLALQLAKMQTGNVNENNKSTLGYSSPPPMAGRMQETGRNDSSLLALQLAAFQQLNSKNTKASFK